MQLTKHWAATLDDYVIDLAWSPDGNQLAAASAAGPVSLFATADGARSHQLPGHDNGTNVIAWRPGSTALATGGQDGSVKFWDAAAGQHTATATLGQAWVEHLAWKVGRVIPNAPGSTGETERRVKDNPPYLAAAAGRDFFFLNSDGSVAHTFKPAPKTITALAFQPAGGCAAMACFGGVTLWDADDFVVQKEFSVCR